MIALTCHSKCYSEDSRDPQWRKAVTQAKVHRLRRAGRRRPADHLRCLMRFAVYVSGDGTARTYLSEGREALTPVFADLKSDVTRHFCGQSTIDIDGGRPAGEGYTMPHTSSELRGSARS